MRTIKFSKIIDCTYEQHNHEIAKTNKHILNNKEFIIYSPCNFNVFITNSCNNKCDFCINKNNQFCNIDDDFYFLKLENSLKFLKGVELESTITGGEPTLFPNRLIRTMEILNKYNVKCRTFSTDGLNLLTRYNNKPLIQYLKDYGFTKNINISRMAIEDNVNDSVMRGQNITNTDIKRIADFCYFNDMDMRISCNLIPKHIDTFDKMIEMVNFYFDQGIRCVMFRELQNVSDFLNINSFFSNINANSEFTHIRTSTGMFYIVNEYYYKDMIVKCYDNKPNINKDIVSSLSFNNVLKIGFNGPVIFDGGYKI